MRVQFLVRALLGSSAAVLMSRPAAELFASVARHHGDSGAATVSSGLDTVRTGMSKKLRGPLFSYLTKRPFEDKVNGRIGQYLIGFWPGERGHVTSRAYQNPGGFLEVTPENENTQISGVTSRKPPGFW